MNTFLAFRASVKYLCSKSALTPGSQRRTLHATLCSAKNPHNSALPLPTSGAQNKAQSKTQSRPEDVKELSSKTPEKLKNDNIPFQNVKLVHSESGALVDTTMAEIKAMMNKKTHFAELQTTVPFPVVKIISKDEARQVKLKAKEIQKSLAKKSVVKEFQLTWGMAQGDLERKMERAREVLVKGGKADLVFARKGRERSPPLSEMKKRLQETIEGLADVSTEWKTRQFRSGIAAAFLQGIEGTKPNETETE
ncbi:hypothetical protein E1B28_003954 [Marasmius oreades]|uniref:Uncharacterized protein n=1 Tax=Marasmius oreades TaxID=181124 RepID=A0A9P8ACK7_9AGAR|nr:uncharacterized protein E1B28_003954 [Marasmius oreades]KAG7096525.1 hypothetical protein E1B28_003954 [Marasmius oreades]